MKRLFSLLIGTCLLVSASIFAAEPIHVTISGPNGNIAGELADGSIEGLAYQHEIVTPRDPASGLATGRRQHKPLTLVKPIDRATPHLYEALAKNRKIDDVILKFYRKDPKTGAMTHYYTIQLVDAFVTSVRGWKPNTRDLSADRAGDLEEVSFYYREIRGTTEGEGGTTTEDTWSQDSA